MERVQKAALRIIIGKEYINYEDALLKADMESLEDRREQLCKNFAEKSIKSRNIRASNMFKENEKVHTMNLREEEKIKDQIQTDLRNQRFN